MSLVNVALRICAKYALLNATYAGARVNDSVAAPIDIATAEDKNPIIILSIDQEETLPRGKDVMSPSSRSVALIIECAVAAKMDIEVEGSEPQQVVAIPQTDSGMETVIAIMVRQIWRALLAGDNEWSQLFRIFFTKFDKVILRRGAGGSDGVRYAARQIIIEGQTLGEPYYGVTELSASNVWTRLFTAMAAVPDLEPLARVLRGEIENPELVDLDAMAAALGTTPAMAAMIGGAETLPYYDPSDPLNQSVPLESGQGAGFPEVDLSEALPPLDEEI